MCWFLHSLPLAVADFPEERIERNAKRGHKQVIMHEKDIPVFSDKIPGGKAGDFVCRKM